MSWYQEEEDEDYLLYSPALLARRASESWIDTPPIEVNNKRNMDTLGTDKQT